jgi:hypothetical protein
MTKQVCRATDLGELIAATYDEAALYSTDPGEVSRLAGQAVAHLLLRARRTAEWQGPPADSVESGAVLRQQLRTACSSVALLDQFRTRSYS